MTTIFINRSHYCHDHITILTVVVLRPPRFWISSSCPAFVQLPTIKEQAWRDKSWLISNILFFLPHCVWYLTIPRPIRPIKGTAGVQIHRRHPPHLRRKRKVYVYFFEEIICFCIEKRINFMPVEKKSLKWQKLYSHFRCWAQVPPSSHSQSVPHYCKPSKINLDN